MKTATTTSNIASALALPGPELDPFDADQRTRIPAAAGIAAVTPATLPVAERIADRIADEVPTLASKVSRETATDAIRDFLTPAAPRPARIEETELDEGVPMVWRDLGHEIRMAYDPAQITPELARGGLALYFDYVEVTDGPTLTPRAARVLEQIEQAKQGQPANYCAFLDIVAREIRLAGDSAAVLDQVLALIQDKTGTAR